MFSVTGKEMSVRSPHVKVFTLFVIALAILCVVHQGFAAVSTTRVSVASGGGQGDGNSGYGSVSADGRYVAFVSGSSNFATGVIADQVYIRDTKAPGQTILVSKDVSNIPANDECSSSTISYDGSRVAFLSYANNLVPGDANNAADAFLYDQSTGKITLVSVSNTGVQADDNTDWAMISLDGKHVVFGSTAKNLAPGATNGTEHIYVRDIDTQKTELITVPASNQGVANADSWGATISSNGRFVVFSSIATNLVSTPAANAFSQIYVRDRYTQTTEVCSLDSIAHVLGNGDSATPAISTDGRYVAFVSDAGNLVAGTPAVTQVYMFDRQLRGQPGAMSVVSRATGAAGAFADGPSSPSGISMSPDGRFVAFDSMAGNLVTGTPLGFQDIFIRDMLNSTTAVVSVNTAGNASDSDSAAPSVSPNGEFVTFTSLADNLVSGDTNELTDVFLRDRAPTGATTPIVKILTAPVAYTDNALLILEGIASAAAPITTVTWSNDRGGSGSCTGTAYWITPEMLLQSGQNTITITASDGTHQGSATIIISYQSTDVTPPQVAITSPADGFITILNTVNLAGTASDDRALLDVKWQNSANGTSGNCVFSSGNWTVTGVGLTAGANLIRVTARDFANHSASASITVNYTQDAQAPQVTINSPADGSSTSAPSTSMSGTATDNVGVYTITWKNAANNATGSCTYSNPNWTVNSVPLATGVNNITVTARDLAGNYSTAQIAITSDCVAPTVRITTPTALGSYSTKAATVDLDGTATDNIGVNVVTWANAATSQSGLCVLNGTNWSATGVHLAAGANIIKITASDDIGNSSQATINISSDSTAPSVAITSPTFAVTKTTPMAMSGTASDNVAVTSVSWLNSKGGGGTCAYSNGAWTASAVLQQGSNMITVTATDSAGNTAQASITVSLDTTAPTVFINAPTTPTDTSPLTLTGTAQDNTAVGTVTWRNTTNNRIGTCTLTGVNWTASIPLQTGGNNITVTATDTVGNTATANTSVSYAVDGPRLTVTDPSLASFGTNNPLLDIKGTASDTIGVTSVSWSSSTGDSGVCAGTTSWSYTGIALHPGQQVITITVTDTSGYTDTASFTIAYYDTEGLTWKGMAVVSLPIVPGQIDPKPIVKFDSNSWFAYRPELQRYSTYADQDHFTWFDTPESTPGRGFWAKFASEVPVPYGVVPAQDLPVTIHLLTGWNIIGNPFISEEKWDLDAISVRQAGSTPISLRDAGGLMAPIAWGWAENSTNPNTGSYYLVYDKSVVSSAAETLAPWQAFWVKAFAECDLILPPPSGK